jgi:hypothetical protein
MGISFILAAARKEMGWDRMGQDGTGWTRTRERARENMDGPEDVRWQVGSWGLGVGSWELACWLPGRGTGVRLAVTLHSVDHSISRFSLHASLTGLHLVEGSTQRLLDSNVFI